MQAAFLTEGWITKDVVVKGRHVVDVRGKVFLRLSELSMLLFVLFGDGVEAAVQIFYLLGQLAQLRASSPRPSLLVCH